MEEEGGERTFFKGASSWLVSGLGLKHNTLTQRVAGSVAVVVCYYPADNVEPDSYRYNVIQFLAAWLKVHIEPQ